MRISDWSSDVCSSDLETFRIALIISACIILERHHLLAIERIRRLPSDYMHAALVKLQPYGAGNLSLAMINRRLKHLALRREPEAVVDQFRIARHQFVLEVRRATIQRDRKSVVWGKSVSVRVDLGGRRSIKKKKTNKQ